MTLMITGDRMGNETLLYTERTKVGGGNGGWNPTYGSLGLSNF